MLGRSVKEGKNHKSERKSSFAGVGSSMRVIQRYLPILK